MEERRMRAIPMLTLLCVCLIGLALAIGAGCTKKAPEPVEVAVEQPAPAPETGEEPEAAEPEPDEGETTEAAQGEAGAEEAPEIKEETVEPGEWITTDSGLKYRDVKVGDGPSPEPGDMVVVHYTGTLKDGTKFDSSRDRGEPYSFAIGQGEVIEGWDEGVMTMKVGGKRELVIPPDLGYGESGRGPIPPNAELHFDVELLEIK
jgi:FKBP-type peptidyl-prolyl cis-trans isomerase